MVAHSLSTTTFGKWFIPRGDSSTLETLACPPASQPAGRAPEGQKTNCPQPQSRNAPCRQGGPVATPDKPPGSHQEPPGKPGGPPVGPRRQAGDHPGNDWPSKSSSGRAQPSPRGTSWPSQAGRRSQGSSKQLQNKHSSTCRDPLANAFSCAWCEGGGGGKKGAEQFGASLLLCLVCFFYKSPC